MNKFHSTTVNRGNETALCQDHDLLMPRNCVSLDQYKSQHLGRLPQSCGKEKAKDKFLGGKIGVDHATGLIFPSTRLHYELEILSKARMPSNAGQNTLPA
jgi:hypothetical protein